MISNRVERQWSQVLRQELSTLGKLYCVSEKEEAIQTAQKNNFDVIFIDAGGTDDAFSLTKKIRNLSIPTRIVIVTSAPTWQLARKAFQSGAIDYIEESFNHKELNTKLHAVLKMPIPH